MSLLIVDAESCRLEERASLSLSGFQERKHLQAWIEQYPQMLGEPLLIINTEFSSFEKSKLRLDILALDKRGKTVVVELKLKAEGTQADLQALRYASKLSSTLRDEIVGLLADYHGISQTESESRIQDFLDPEADADLPQDSVQPRIILAAESFDTDLTTCVLWLRESRIDIRCVELAAYKLPDGSVAIVPRVIIPLPQAEQYLDRVRKRTEAIEEAQDRASQSQGRHEAILTCLRKLRAEVSADAPKQNWMWIKTNEKGIHYEVLLQQRRIGVSLDFESDDASENRRRFDFFEARRDQFKSMPNLEFQRERRGGRWCRIGCWVDYTGWTPDVADAVAIAMNRLIDLCSPVLAELSAQEKIS